MCTAKFIINTGNKDFIVAVITPPAEYGKIYQYEVGNALHSLGVIYPEGKGLRIKKELHKIMELIIKNEDKIKSMHEKYPTLLFFSCVEFFEIILKTREQHPKTNLVWAL